ncbi:FKBP12-interacting protein of 37 kDa [Capsicum chinense]|nr:FKBP12-interacting protein of 37 kDa [Capsicum chinense]
MAFLRPPSIEGLDALLSLRASTISSYFLKGKYNPLVVKKRYAEKAQMKKMKKALFNGTPDFSMPYNVITITCTVFSLYFGSLLNALHRRTEEEERLLKSKVDLLSLCPKMEAQYCYCFTECDGVPKLLLSLIDIYFSNLVEEKDKKVKELQDKIAAVNFTPESKVGKMLMAKCRTLQEENEEIGNQANEGKVLNDFLDE